MTYPVSESYLQWANTHESDIKGEGPGSEHKWHFEWTSPSRTSYYKCALCYENFAHHYPSQPNIFTAMLEADIPSICPREPINHVRPEYHRDGT